jgi:hypothetical protein
LKPTLAEPAIFELIALPQSSRDFMDLIKFQGLT